MNVNQIFKTFRDEGIGLHDDDLELREWNQAWSRLAQSEIRRLRESLGSENSALHHIGSTSVSGLCAKPIIDLIAEVTNLNELDMSDAQLLELGYRNMGEYGIKGRRFFTLKDSNGKTYIHLHIFAYGDERVRKHLEFRDYLSSNPDALARYRNFKELLLIDDKVQRNNYSGKKEPIMKILTNEASEWAKKRY